MKIRVPDYFLKFKCIADQCQDSCCIGWEIDIDGKTLDKYASLSGDLGCEIRQKTQHGYFPLQNNGRCAFLDCEGLCRIISGVGEDYLCDICREHPRYYGVGKYGIEGGLGLACPEAARIILTIDEWPKAVEINREVCYCDEDDYKELGESIRERLYESIFKGSVAELAGLYIAYARAADDAAFEALGGNRTAVSIWKVSYLPIDNKEIKRLLCGMLDLLSECESLTDNWNDVLKRSSEIKAEELSQETVRSLL